MPLDDFRKFYLTLAPSGAAADATETDEGEITDTEAETAETGAEESEAVEETEADTAEPETQSDPFEAFRQAGIPTDPALISQQFNALRQQAERARQLEAWYYQQQAQAQQAQQQQQPEKPKLPWDLPEFDRQWISMLTRDEQGNLVARPGARPDLPQQVTKYAEAREAALDQFLRDPYGTLQTGLGPWVQQQAAQIAQQMIAQQQQQFALQQYAQQNRDMFFEPNGNLNPVGQAFDRFYREGVQLGVPNPVMYAERQLDAELFRFHSAQEQQAASTPTEAEKKLAFQKAAAKRTANRGGTVASRTRAKPPQDKNALWSDLRDKLSQLPKEDFESN